MIEDGEIPFLDADPLHSGIEAREESTPRTADDLAIERVCNRLRQQGGRSEEVLEEISVDLYNKLCENIRSGRASEEQLRSAAELFGENPDDLRARLRG